MRDRLWVGCQQQDGSSRSLGQAYDLRAATNIGAAGSDARTGCHPNRDKKQNRLHLGQSCNGVWRQQGPVRCGATVGRGNRDHQPLQCNVGLTLLYGAVPCGTEVAYDLQSSPRRIEGLIRRELCHRSAFGSDGMVRSTSTAERPRKVRNLENHQAKCQCDKGLLTSRSDKPKATSSTL